MPDPLPAGRRPTGGGPQVWFLTGSQDLYGDETLAHVERHS